MSCTVTLSSISTNCESIMGGIDVVYAINYADIDAISGATKTTDGYKGAILNAFKAVKIFEGGDK